MIITNFISISDNWQLIFYEDFVHHSTVTFLKYTIFVTTPSLLSVFYAIDLHPTLSNRSVAKYIKDKSSNFDFMSAYEPLRRRSYTRRDNEIIESSYGYETPGMSLVRSIVIKILLFKFPIKQSQQKEREAKCQLGYM